MKYAIVVGNAIGAIQIFRREACSLKWNERVAYLRLAMRSGLISKGQNRTDSNFCLTQIAVLPFNARTFLELAAVRKAKKMRAAENHAGLQPV